MFATIWDEYHGRLGMFVRSDIFMTRPLSDITPRDSSTRKAITDVKLLDAGLC